MDFYCCVHSQEAVNLHQEKRQKHLNYVDKDIPYKYICGTKSRNDFATQVIDAYDDNIAAKYNKKLRQYSSLYYLINTVNDRFYFGNCSTFLRNYDLKQVETVDLAMT